MRSCPPSPEWTAHENIARLPCAYGSFARRIRRPVKAAGPRPWAHFPRSCRDLYHTSRQPGDAAQYLARRPAPRLTAAGRLPILGRLWAPGAFRRVPEERPAKHQPGHYRRGEPSGQADQHPRPQAHPLTPSGTPTLAVPSAHSHDQPCRSVTAERRYGAPLSHALASGPVPGRPAARRRVAIHHHVPRRAAPAGGHRRGTATERREPCFCYTLARRAQRRRPQRRQRNRGHLRPRTRCHLRE
jgi:hypothetical protein